MAIILNIDTATETGSVCLAKDGISLSARANTRQKDHASVMTLFIQELLEESGTDYSRIDAVAVSGGPGSYTGIRVATSTAKGLCYAWNIPLIAINTLKMMANGMTMVKKAGGTPPLLCPMIDARRTEVFTALYDWDLAPLVKPRPSVLDDDFLKEYRQSQILVFGSGMNKAEKLFRENTSWVFVEFSCHAAYMASLSEQAFKEKKFENLAYFEPWYLKAFHKNFTHS